MTIYKHMPYAKALLALVRALGADEAATTEIYINASGDALSIETVERFGTTTLTTTRTYTQQQED